MGVLFMKEDKIVWGIVYEWWTHIDVIFMKNELKNNWLDETFNEGHKIVLGLDRLLDTQVLARDQSKVGQA